MNREQMRRMSASELDAYAKVMGFSVRGAKTVEQKASLIEERRGRAAELTVLGVNLSIPIKRLRDKRVTDLLAKEGRTDDETERVIRTIVGDEAWDALVDAATEEDGTVDNDALGYAVVAILTSRELKNF